MSMKNVKKILAFGLAVMILLAMSSVAFAEDSFTITIDNAVAGETYSAYKVFDVTYDNPVTSAPTVIEQTGIPGSPDDTSFYTAYSYTIRNDSTFWGDLIEGVTPTNGEYRLTLFGLNFIPTTTEGIYNVMPIDETVGVTATQAQALAVFLATKLSGKIPVATAEATAETVSFNDYATGKLELDVTAAGAGYYFVDTTTGSLCSLDTTEPNATIREKNSIPSQTKKVSDVVDGTFGEDVTIKIGDTAFFKIEVTNSRGTDKAIIVHDIMDSALTLDLNSFAIKIDGSDVARENYTIKYSSSAVVKNATEAGDKVSSATLSDGCTFEIIFKDSFIQDLAKNEVENDVIVITYEAELNENASTADLFQKNKSHIEYSEQNTVETVVTVKTHEVDVVKTDGSNKLLDGATFNLFDAATGGNKYNLVKVEDGKYRLAVSTDSSYAGKLMPKEGKLTIIGLENGTYYLEEVDHPDGYNPLTERKDFVIINANNSAQIDGTTYTQGGVHVINKSGTELPSTGGIGTTIFYVIGGLLVVGAGVVLVSRRKSQDD